MAKLWDYILPVHQSINEVGHQYALLYLSPENTKLIDEFDGSSSATHFVKTQIGHLACICHECVANISNDQRFIDLKNEFSELLMFVKIASKFKIRKVPEDSFRTPDFKIVYPGGDLYLELKALNMVDGIYKYKSLREEALDKKIELEQQLRRGSKIGLTEQVVSPYLKERNRSEYDPQSTSLVVTALNEKITQNVKPEQFELGTTGMLIDFSDQMLLHGSPRENLDKEFESAPSGALQSGELWHLAFGKLGESMKSVEDFEGANNEDIPLSCEGILRKYPFIAGLVFHVRDQFWGTAIRRRENIQFVRFLEKLCAHVVTVSE